MSETITGTSIETRNGPTLYGRGLDVFAVGASGEKDHYAITSLVTGSVRYATRETLLAEYEPIYGWFELRYRSAEREVVQDIPRITAYHLGLIGPYFERVSWDEYDRAYHAYQTYRENRKKAEEALANEADAIPVRFSRRHQHGRDEPEFLRHPIWQIGSSYYLLACVGYDDEPLYNFISLIGGNRFYEGGKRASEIQANRFAHTPSTGLQIVVGYKGGHEFDDVFVAGEQVELSPHPNEDAIVIGCTVLTFDEIDAMHEKIVRFRERLSTPSEKEASTDEVRQDQ